MDRIGALHYFAYRWKMQLDWVSPFDLNVFIEECESLGFKEDKSLKLNVGPLFREKDIDLICSYIYTKAKGILSGEDPEEKIVSWYLMTMQRLYLLTDPRLQIFNKPLESIKIVSNNVCFGILPRLGDILEQHLSIRSNGRVYVGYYSSIDYFKLKCSKRLNKRISEADFLSIKDALLEYLTMDEILFVTDVGHWDMKITASDGSKEEWCGPIFESNNHISTIIREKLGLDDLFIFDGYSEPDSIEEFKLNYSNGEGRREAFSFNGKDSVIKYSFHDESGIAEEHLITNKELVFKIASGINDSLLFNYGGAGKHGFERQYSLEMKKDKAGLISLSGDYILEDLPLGWVKLVTLLRDSIPGIKAFEMFKPLICSKSMCSSEYLILCYIRFPGTPKKYCYLANSDLFDVGDKVIVPVGYGKDTSVAEIVEIRYESPDDLEYPLEKLKTIIGPL